MILNAPPSLNYRFKLALASDEINVIKEALFLILPTFKSMVTICDYGKGEILVQIFVQEATIRQCQL